MSAEPDSLQQMVTFHMASQTPQEAIVARAAAVRARFEEDGVNVSEWARERGFDVKLTHLVLQGKRRCRRGQSHQIAVALGVKGVAPAAPTVVDRLNGARV